MKQALKILREVMSSKQWSLRRCAPFQLPSPRFLARRGLVTAELRRRRLEDEKMGLFNRMLGVCSAAGDFHGAERILQRAIKSAFEPQTLTLALVVAACAEARDVVRAELWLRRICLTGMHADVPGHPEVIGSLMDAGAAPLAHVAKQAAQDTVAEHTAESRLSSHLHVLRKHSKLSEDEMTSLSSLWEELVQQHKNSGTPVSRPVLQATLQVLARCNRQEEIQALLKDLPSLGLRPDQKIYGILIEGAALCKDVAPRYPSIVPFFPFYLEVPLLFRLYWGT